MKKGCKKAKLSLTVLYSEQTEEQMSKLYPLFLVTEMEEILQLNPKVKENQKGNQGKRIMKVDTP